MDFEKEITKLAKTVEPEGYEISPEAQWVTIQGLQDIDRRYGAESDNPLEHHNAPHGLDVIRRNIRLTNIFFEFIPKKYRRHIYDLDSIGGGLHDHQRGVRDGLNEKLSADFADELIVKTGHSPINTKRFKARERSGILATQVETSDSGEITQVNLRQGERDPFKLIMAYGDINGIAMEGGRRMVRDAVNLCLETHDNPTAEDIYQFMLFQAKFLKDRLNDEQVKADIAYYFPSQTEEVFQRAKKEFRHNIVSAYAMANLAHKTPHLKDSIGSVLNAADHIPGSGVLGGVILKALNSGK